MTMAIRGVFDALYGSISFEDDLATLVATPIVQRMRHVRLSNIDSLNMPGIANCSRFEHILGVAYLSTQLPLTKSLLSLERRALIAAAALHDWAITAFGHLVEEAYQFAGTSFHHEKKLAQIISTNPDSELGGVSRQILLGRPTGLLEWAEKMAGADAPVLIERIVQNIQGKGSHGQIIAGDIDIDNIDNVFRVAYHIGLEVDRGVPLALARAIVGVAPDTGVPIFAVRAKSNLQSWVELRSSVYSMLMPAEYDFAGKIMILASAVSAIEAGELADVDWSMTDQEFLSKMLTSSNANTSTTAQRWICGELWDVSPLHWMAGTRPSLPDLLKFSKHLEELLGRHCFAYGIKDKRSRKLSIKFENGDDLELGSSSNQWLFGVGSARKFTHKESAEIIHLAEAFFNTHSIAPYGAVERVSDQLALL